MPCSCCRVGHRCLRFCAFALLMCASACLLLSCFAWSAWCSDRLRRNRGRSHSVNTCVTIRLSCYKNSKSSRMRHAHTSALQRKQATKCTQPAERHRQHIQDTARCAPGNCTPLHPHRRFPSRCYRCSAHLARAVVSTGSHSMAGLSLCCIQQSHTAGTLQCHILVYMPSAHWHACAMP